MSERECEIVYHYTSLSTFESIVKFGELRLNDITKSNDPIECTFSLNAMESAYHKIINSEEYSKEQLQFLHLCVFDYLREKYCYGRLNNLVLAASFCDPVHELLLWRSYGDNGNGVAIGFSKEELMRFIKINDGFKFEKTQYLPSQELEKRACDVLKRIIHTIPHDYEDIPEEAKKQLDDFYLAGYFIKHDSNSDENEYRLLWHNVDLESYAVPLLGQRIDNLDFTATSNGLKAYIPIPLAHTNETNDNANRHSLMINNIVLGVKCMTSPAEMQLFLTQHGLCYFGISQSTNVHIS